MVVVDSFSSQNIMRNKLRKRRKSISIAQSFKYGKKLLHNCLKLNILNNKRIALYLANDGEIKTQQIINFLIQFDIEVYLPIIIKDKLKFAQIGKYYRNNRFHIQEPIDTKILAANQLNIIFMPLVGFNENRNRLGMGGGFYDKSLSFKFRQKSFKIPKLYGLAFNNQRTTIKPNIWDVKLDKIITQSTII